ncbi:MAG: hypothetical protein RJQ08_13505 [Salinisphaeraceae bacterium]
MPDNAHLDCYLILQAEGPIWAPVQKVKADRVTAKPPALKANQRALKLSLKIPRALFATPQLAANICVPDEAISAPIIDVETVTRIEELVSREVGVSLQISVVGQQEGNGHADAENP